MRLRSKAAVKDWSNTIMVSTRHIFKQGDSFSYKQKTLTVTFLAVLPLTFALTYVLAKLHLHTFNT